MYVSDLEFYKNSKNANKELFEIDYATSTMLRQTISLNCGLAFFKGCKNKGSGVL